MAEITFTSSISGKNSHSNSKHFASLKTCFQALVDRKQVNLDIGVLEIILKYEFQINLDNLQPNLSSVLPYMLVFYIKNWPGWQKSKEYYSGKVNYREWFLKFRQFISLRLTYIIQHGYTSIIAKEQEDKLKHNQDEGTQTESQTDKIDIAPFAISIKCPPKMLSSLIFSACDGNIVLSRHQDYHWPSINIFDLVNWPHVGVEFVNSELSFKRNNKSEYRRYINFVNCVLDTDTIPPVENVEIIDPNVERQCFTLDLLLVYVQQYYELLQKLPNISKSKLIAVKVFVEAFLQDIHEIGILLGQKNSNITIATNTSILFNIGQSSFVRNKKLLKKSLPNTIHNREVGFSETFIPKIELQLDFFKDSQDTTSSNISFVCLNQMKTKIESKSDLNIFIPVIIFKCLFCDVKFDQHETLISHFLTLHGMEANFKCVKCRKSLSTNVLSRVRWKHNCEKTTA